MSSGDRLRSVWISRFIRYYKFDETCITLGLLTVLPTFLLRSTSSSNLRVLFVHNENHYKSNFVVTCVGS